MATDEPTPAPAAAAAAAHPPRMTRRQMSVLFCDIVGSTELAQRIDPEELLDVLGAFEALVRREATRFGGFVAKVVGDGIDVYFGYPLAGEDDAVCAVQAGLAIVDGAHALHEAAGLAEPVQVRAGIATGLVAIGALHALAIAGSTPNLAARIQAVARPGQVVIAPSTRRIAGRQFDWLDLGAFDLKGFETPVRLAAVTGAAALDSRSAWRGRDATIALVGRDAELDALVEAWSVALSNRVSSILVVAEPGLGKSRLVHALDERLRETAHATLKLQCSPFHANSPLQPWARHLSTAASFGREDTQEARLEKLEAQLAIAGVNDALDIALIAALMDIEAGARLLPPDLPPRRVPR